VVGWLMAYTAVILRQFNPSLFDAIDRPDVDAVCADYFHMLFDFAWISHLMFLHG
jgi:hypothetical protein